MDDGRCTNPLSYLRNHYGLFSQFSFLVSTRRQESLMAKNRDLSHSVIHLTNIIEGDVSLPDQLPDLVAVSPADREKLAALQSFEPEAFLPSAAASIADTGAVPEAPDPFEVAVDPFKEDPFAGFGGAGTAINDVTASSGISDPFNDADPFGSAGFGTITNDAAASSGKPRGASFGDFDPFSSSLGGKTDEDDPFGGAATTTTNSGVVASSVPDLPPKMSKAVPPRPAAPPARPTAGPSPRPSPIPGANSSSSARVSPVPTAMAPKSDSLSPSPLPKLNPVRAAPLRPSKPPASTSGSR